VLAGDLGSEIECPTCRATYTAARADAPLPPGGVAAPPSSKLVKFGSGRDDDDDDDDDDRRRKRKKRRDDEYEEPPPPPKRRRGGNRAPGTVSLTRIGPISFGLTMGIIYAIMALIFGVLGVLLMGCAGAVLGSQVNDSRFVGLLGAGIFMALLYTLLYAFVALIGGFIGGVVFAILYNVVVKLTGGIEMDLE
jgi:hypothetical protein